VSGNFILGNGAFLTGIAASYGNTEVAAYLPTYTGSLPNLTGAVTTTANVTGGNIIATVDVVAQTGRFVGNGSGLTDIVAANITGTVANATFAVSAGTVTTNAQPNITSVGTLTALSSSGNITGANINGNGSGLSAITGANVTGTVANATFATSAGSADTATTAGTVTTNAQPNITSVGTLTALSVTGNID
jgi:hypothetical protein